MTTQCAVCSSATRLSHSDKLMCRLDVDYFYCDECGLLQTEKPYWLDDAYADVIALSDTGLLSRNISLAMRLTAVLYFLFERDARYVDAGGGYGVLTRLMRDVGFDFYWSDPYCANLFAKGFEAVDGGPFAAVTAFEVVEHVHDPVGFIREALSQNRSKSFLFSTQLFEGGPPPVTWPYYSQETGQHISFYQRRTLERIARNLQLNLFSSGYFHLLTDREVNNAKFMACSSRAAFAAFPMIKARLRSRTWPDRQRAMEVLRQLDGRSEAVK